MASTSASEADSLHPCVICAKETKQIDFRAFVKNENRIVMMEKIVERKWTQAKFISDGICVECEGDVVEAEIRWNGWREAKDDIKDKFEKANPGKKRGRKRKEEKVEICIIIFNFN
jgi:hypothetical protein